MSNINHVTVYFVIPIFSFVIIEPCAPKFVCVSRGRVVIIIIIIIIIRYCETSRGAKTVHSSRSPLAAISAGYMCTTKTCVVTGSQKFDNTANSSVVTEMKIQIEHQRSLVQGQV